MVSMSLLLVARQPGLAGNWLHSLSATVKARFYIAYHSIAGDVVTGRVVWTSFALLWGGTAMAVWSLVIYTSNVWTHFIYPQPKH